MRKLLTFVIFAVLIVGCVALMSGDEVRQPAGQAEETGDPGPEVIEAQPVEGS